MLVLAVHLLRYLVKTPRIYEILLDAIIFHQLCIFIYFPNDNHAIDILHSHMLNLLSELPAFSLLHLNFNWSMDLLNPYQLIVLISVLVIIGYELLRQIGILIFFNNTMVKLGCGVLISGDDNELVLLHLHLFDIADGD